MTPAPQRPWPFRYGQSRRNCTGSEERERGSVVVLDVEPPQVPPYVGLCGGDGHVFIGPRPAEMDPGSSYQGHRPVPLLDQGDSEEVPPQLKVRFDPQEFLAQHDEGRDLLDPVRVEVLQLYLIVMKEPSEEGMRGRPEPALVEVHEGDDVAITRHRQLLAAR
jgi:hypothetical protein